MATQTLRPVGPVAVVDTLGADDFGVPPDGLLSVFDQARPALRPEVPAPRLPSPVPLGNPGGTLVGMAALGPAQQQREQPGIQRREDLLGDHRGVVARPAPDDGGDLGDQLRLRDGAFAPHARPDDPFVALYCVFAGGDDGLEAERAAQAVFAAMGPTNRVLLDVEAQEVKAHSP